ncbi:elongation of very long chain fatty acids protein 4-like [Dendronephthya gigantea]|uniref:elongation of very long chain fatty acids protein 4-like n=1 Tax=Dendronephthya gigantea TaxID=151771 RepID=UPI00106BFCE5|nr:elongation of very long chain fatty acids protein 4-like [Dendronephthya gigantea]
MNQFVTEATEYYNWLESISDPRTKDWFLVSSIFSPLSACSLYLLVVNIGPRFMEKRQPFETKIPMALYNFGATALSWYCFTELLIGSWNAGYNYICQRVIVSNEPQHLQIAKVLWWFYVSKYYEMLDTVFFILRKKPNQITFLHVYHHTTILGLWWIGIKWVPGGSSFFSSMVNSFVHVVMYTYYGLSVFPTLRRYLWWKRYLTQLQLIQFVSNFLQAILGLREDCGFPRWMAYGMLSYMISMFMLFGNFYYRTYTNKTVAANRVTLKETYMKSD